MAKLITISIGGGTATAATPPVFTAATATVRTETSPATGTAAVLGQSGFVQAILGVGTDVDFLANSTTITGGNGNEITMAVGTVGTATESVMNVKVGSYIPEGARLSNNTLQAVNIVINQQ